MKGYMSAREASYKWGVSESRVHMAQSHVHRPHPLKRQIREIV